MYVDRFQKGMGTIISIILSASLIIIIITIIIITLRITFIADVINNGQILIYCNIDISCVVSVCLLKFLLNSLSLIVFSC